MVLEWGSCVRKNGRGRHGNGVFTVIFYLKKEASEANGQNVYIYLIFMKDTKAFVFFVFYIF